MREYWSIRQNPYANTNQIHMRDFILSHGVITCPFGHLAENRDNVVSGVYNEKHPTWKSHSQDRKFIEKVKIGDIVVIPFVKIKACILARIVSEPIYDMNTGMFTTKYGKIHLSKEGTVPFCPVVRRIQIINDNLIFSDKRCLPRITLAHVSRSILIPIHPNYGFLMFESPQQFFMFMFNLFIHLFLLTSAILYYNLYGSIL